MDLLKVIKEWFLNIIMYFFLLVEIMKMVEVLDGFMLEEVVCVIYEVGLDFLLGGGVEILDDCICCKISCLKGLWCDWMDVM